MSDRERGELRNFMFLEVVIGQSYRKYCEICVKVHGFDKGTRREKDRDRERARDREREREEEREKERERCIEGEREKEREINVAKQ